MTNEKNFHIIGKPLFAFILVIVVGAYLLSIMEGVEFYESIYLTFLLVSTVTHYPVVTIGGKILSAVLVIVGLGLILYTATAVTRVLMRLDIHKLRARKNDLKKTKR